MIARPVLRPVLAAMALAGLACVLPDKEIEFEDEAISNRNPVRLVEATMLTAEAELSCETEPDEKYADPGTCPQPGVDPTDVFPHFLDPNHTRPDRDDPNRLIRPFLFCSCLHDKADSNTLLYTLYVEDQDEESRSRDPRDKIYAALLLDVPQGAVKPDRHVDYLRYVDPERQLDLSEAEYKPRRRRDPQLRELVLGIEVGGDDQIGLDLCNGGDAVLSPGYHSLTVMVTDRPWFQPPGNGSRHFGVPDLAAGATFDTMTYVFYCGSEAAEGDPDGCATRCQLPGQGNQ